ncbi:hypothetical protein QR680_014799 [Steinernema hermaphroditum]|uniref:Glycogen debranching enzyme C-terminal domain-containing protein n=1 Tax=Steinernema hermaphroditum TaxID=289476 RepID=A0AA39IA52_9BILA|nr:hypothetical protein QR680_014799 [Steinernema hermaphroditum]
MSALSISEALSTATQWIWTASCEVLNVPLATAWRRHVRNSLNDSSRRSGRTLLCKRDTLSALEHEEALDRDAVEEPERSYTASSPVPVFNTEVPDTDDEDNQLRTNLLHNEADALGKSSLSVLAAIIRYIQMKPSGHEIFNETVVRHYPTDESEFCEDGRKETLADTMLEVIECHFRGIEFREMNTGHAIDEHMKDPGFNVKAYIDKDTGFVFGGNEWNCGTWMDKMGSSDKARNRGIPATPRDGADVELQGLCLYVVEGLRDLSKDGKFKKDSRTDRSPWSSLPELTQAEGEHCPGSCEAQAWSIGCLLEAVVALDKYNKQ